MATLYRQYRPQQFADLIGQDHVRQTLQSALAHDRSSHAYLFAGPRGVGKTTVARLLAKAINCQSPVIDGERFEPCNSCPTCVEITEGRSLDVIEIDAASNRGIDEMRDLRDKIKFAPSSAPFKVFIIDEVHMLTKEAFNALLKTLEEPPAHAKFVLATTELHKVPVTIASRCQVFMFKKANMADLATRLGVVAAAEGFTVEPDALTFLARLASGSYRDGLSLLDQVRTVAGGTITKQAIQEVLGIPSEERILALFQAMAAGQVEAALAVLASAETEGLDLDHVATQMIDATRALLHLSHGIELGQTSLSERETGAWQALTTAWTSSELASLIRELAQAKALMKQASVPLLPLELVVVTYTKSPVTPTHIQTPPSSQAASSKSSAPERPVASSAAPVAEQSDEEDVSDEASPVEELVAEEPSAQTMPVIPAGDLGTEFWLALLARVREQNMSIFGMLTQAEFAGVHGAELHVRVPFAFARDRLMDRKHHTALMGYCEDLTGRQLVLVCEIAPRQPMTHQPDAEHDPSVLAAAAEVFGLEEAGA